MKNVWYVCRRELISYFTTPVAYVFIVVFLGLTGWFTFSQDMGNFLARGQADLQSFFILHPWVYLFLIPAISMRLWAEERKTGTIELLFTLPITMGEAVVGKFLAAWIFTGIALAMTFPIWLTVSYLGNPDHGVIVASYLGSFLMAGAYLVLGAAVSAITRNQVIAFVLTGVLCLIFILAGYPAVLGLLESWMPEIALDGISSLSFLTQFRNISRGVIALPSLVFFLSLIVLGLFANTVILDLKKAN